MRTYQVPTFDSFLKTFFPKDLRSISPQQRRKCPSSVSQDFSQCSDQRLRALFEFFRKALKSRLIARTVGLSLGMNSAHAFDRAHFNHSRYGTSGCASRSRAFKST